ncbi:MAG: hypothetical protein GC192_21035 [Bacteroidetes bacterium]|nr:hypothetical protein [Bacteroidota bacterium]
MKPLFSLLTYKQQSFVLCLALVGVCILIFQLSISRTLKIYSNYRNDEDKIKLAANASIRIDTLQKKLISIQASSIRPYNREKLLEYVTGFCRNKELLIRSFPEALVADQNKSEVITNQIEVEGSFKEMVQLVYLLEVMEKQGSISSLKFYLYKDRLMKRTVLRSLITIRNLES